MFKNYFLLNRMVIELDNEITGSVLKEIFTQEKDKLVIRLQSNSEDKFLIVSVNQNEPYIMVKDEFHRAKKK